MNSLKQSKLAWCNQGCANSKKEEVNKEATKQPKILIALLLGGDNNTFKGQAHKMFSRIFQIQIYKKFLPNMHLF